MRWRNHLCLLQEIGVAFSECAFVALVIQLAMLIQHIVTVIRTPDRQAPWRVAYTVYAIPTAGIVRRGSVHRDRKPKYSTGSSDMFHGRKVNLIFIFVFVSVEE